MQTFREVLYVKEVPQGIQAILVGDIGGTNCNFGVFKYENGVNTFLVSLHCKSQEITDFTAVVQDLLAHLKTTYDIIVKRTCLAAAGIVSPDRDYSKPTNLTFSIDTKDIIQRTGIECAFLANDFEVIGYGLSLINPNDLVKVNGGCEQLHTNKAVLGAGTGLGKCILLWDRYRQMYDPVASEGGHADFAPQNELEYELVEFIKKERAMTCSVSWEDILSGNGIMRIYKFFKLRNHAIKSDPMLAKNGLHPDEIFKSRHLDDHAWNTFELYAKVYGQCAKNFALDSLARGGVYIAGGIAAKNLELFRQPAFLQAFLNCGKQQELLKQIPIFVITDYNISLYGAAEYMRLEGMCG